MMASNTVAVNRGVLVVGAVLLVGIGAGGAWFLLTRPSPPVASSSVQAPLSPAPSAARQPATVTLTKEAAERAGIELATVSTSRAAASLRIPGVVQPNAYKAVAVTPLTGGRVTRVAVELGAQVRRGQLLAEIYSQELVEAGTRYRSARAELEAHELELQRTERLVAIGAASRQELERIHAEHASAIALADSNRSRLALLGVSEQDAQNLTPQSESLATLRVVAPANGLVTARAANVGLNVDPSMALFTIADLSEVWVVGDLYERDFPTVAVGASVSVLFSAYPDVQLAGRVAYIDPQVRADTRTAQVRVAVANPKGQLRLGMLAEMRIGDSRVADALTIPRAAVQTIGDRTVVYVADPSDPTRFVERDVTIDPASGAEVARVLSGLKAGDVVVAKGSFSLRAERDRVGASQPVPSVSAPPPQMARIEVTDLGYEPSTVSFKAGVPARLTFVRSSERTCGTEVVVPSLNIRRSLPLNQPVDLDFTPSAGTIDFACGMAMLKGTVVVQ